MSMLTIIQRFTGERGLPVPTTVYGTTDPQVKQIMRILETEGNALAVRHTWESLIFEASHTSLAAEDQGAIATIATNGFRHIKNETIWDRTTNLPIYGPMSDREWQAMKGMAATGARYRYRIRGGKLLVNPTPVASESWYFEYASKNWITDSTGVTYRQYFAADGDLTLLAEDLLQAGLTWRWLRAKGFDYSEEFNTYEALVADAMGHDGGKPTIYQDGCTDDARPRVFVPAGNWAVP